jgi:imidazolonepropionase-like amidohydrolase
MIYVHCQSLYTGVADQPLGPATLVIDGERINQVLEGWQDEPGAVVVDFRDYSILPGLIDAHDHFGIDMGDGEEAARQDPQWRAIKGVKNARAMLHTGITTLRNAGELHNMGAHIRRAIDAGWIEGPRTVLSGIPISSTGGHGWFVGMEADGAEGVRAAVRHNVKLGADMIKMIITGGATTPGSKLVRSCFTQTEIATAVTEAHLAEKKIGVHCYGGDAATWAIEAGVDSIEHGTFLGDDQLDIMAQRGTWLIATSSVMTAAAEAPHVPEFMKPRFLEAAERYVDVLRRARARGVRVAVGCDTNHCHIPEEITTLLKAGYSSLEAIRVATYAGAIHCGLQDQVGSLETGKYADFLVVPGDPTHDLVRSLRSLKAVAKSGKFLMLPPVS